MLKGVVPCRHTAQFSQHLVGDGAQDDGGHGVRRQAELTVLAQDEAGRVKVPGAEAGGHPQRALVPLSHLQPLAPASRVLGEPVGGDDKQGMNNPFLRSATQSTFSYFITNYPSTRLFYNSFHLHSEGWRRQRSPWQGHRDK